MCPRTTRPWSTARRFTPIRRFTIRRQAYYAAGMAISFGVGVAMGAMWGGGWGYHCGWGGGDNNVYINNNNNFVNHNNNINNINRRGTGPTPATPTGSTIRSTGEARPIRTGRPPTSTAVRLAGTQPRRGKPMRARTRVQGAQAGPRQEQWIAVREAGPSLGRWIAARGAATQASTMDRGGGGGGDRVGNRSVSPSASASNRSAYGGSSGG